MSKLEKWLSAYEADVRYPDVSGMEHLDMLMTRSELENHKNNLNYGQLLRLSEADNVFLTQSPLFYDAIEAIADISQWRMEAQMPKSHWWWYLDILAYVPWVPARRVTNQVVVA